MRQPTRQLAFDWGEAGEAQPVRSGEPNRTRMSERAGALAEGLMEAVVAAGNLRRALRRVQANKGSPGVGGMTVQELPEYLEQEWPRLRDELLEGRSAGAVHPIETGFIASFHRREQPRWLAERTSS